jgi:hypothetical protein
VFVSAQLVLAIAAFGLASAAALAVTSVGYARLALARNTGQSQSPAAVGWLVCGVWALVVLGQAVAIVLGTVGYGLVESARFGSGD